MRTNPWLVVALLGVALPGLVGCGGEGTGFREQADGGGPPCLSTDTDGDGIADALEGDFDQDMDGVPSKLDDDSDGDGVLDADEQLSGNPCGLTDSDSDGIPDAYDLDSDNDGLSDREETEAGTSRQSEDTDGDGIPDVVELRGARTDPLDASSTIPESDFYVVLPHMGDRQSRRLLFGTDIKLADVFFLMDTTASMQHEVRNVRDRMERVIIPGVEALVSDVQFGAGGFDDFTGGIHGTDPDRPYYHLIDIVPSDQDLGSFSPSTTYGNIEEFAADGPNGTPDILEAVRTYPTHGGGNPCESGIEALYQTATGEGVSWDDDMVPPKRCDAVLDERGRRRGYPCFRPGALPIIVYVSDAPLYTPLPAGWETGDVFELICNYDDVEEAHTYEEARVALLGIGARVVALSTADDPPDSIFPSTEHMCRLAADTGAVRADGTPLCFEIGSDGANIDSDVVSALTELVGGTPMDVTTRREDVQPNPDGVDATGFIQSVIPFEGYVDAIPGLGYSRKDEATFFDVIPGSRVEFTIDFWNDFRPPSDVSEVFTARIVVVGNGVTDLDSRNVYILVPPEGSVLLI